MPLALLLARPLTAFRNGVRRLRRWESLTATEALVLGRQRGAFLARWFGTGVSVHNLHLQATIANLGAVQDRIRGLGDRRPGRPAASLLEPLMGAGGGLAGALTFPLNSMLAGAAVATISDTWWVVVLGVLNWLAAGALLSAALVAAGPAGSGVLAIMAGSDQAAPARNVLGHLAAVGRLLRDLHEQLTSGDVKNPLLRAALQLGDAAAGLFAQLVGSLLWLLSRVVPALGPLTTAAVAAVGLGRQLVGASRRIFTDVADGLPRLFDREHGPLSAVGRALQGMVSALKAISERVRTIPALMSRALEPLTASLAAWWSGFDPKVVVTRHPLVIALTDLAPTIGILIAHAKDIAYGLLRRIPLIGPRLVSFLSTPSGPFMTELKQKAWQKALDLLQPPPSIPSFPPLPRLDLPETAALPAGFTPADPATAASAGPPIAEAIAAVAAASAARLPDVFAAEAAGLRAVQDRARAQATETLTYLRVARHALAPAAADSIRALEDVLRDLDRGARPRARLFPVREVVPVQALHPNVKRMVVIAEAASKDGLRDYAQRVKTSLGTQAYELALVG